MLNREEHITLTVNAFVKLGKFINQFSSIGFLRNNDLYELNDKFEESFTRQIKDAAIYNPWFTEEFIRYSFGSIVSSLEEEKILRWLSYYPELHREFSHKKIIGLVMAGNIPLVGFHDVISVVLSGNILLAKLSSKDDKLFPVLREVLCHVYPALETVIEFSDRPLRNIDAVIATGSNNSSRYFEYYFGKYPHIIRNNRNSAAVLTGSESKRELEKLADDIFTYFGLGCRNVSKIFLPKDYDPAIFLEQFEGYSYLYNHNKYANNYNYHRAIFLIDRVQHLDNGFMLLKEDKGYSSPAGVLYYERYDNIEDLRIKLNNDSDKIQCLIASDGIIEGSLPFGESQHPDLWNYADNVDTLKFLINLYKK